MIYNSKRGVWAVNDDDLDIKNISPDDIVKHVKDEDRKNRQQKTSKEHVKKINDLEEHEQEDEWKHELLETISKIEPDAFRSEEHTSELQSRGHLVCRLLLEKKRL